MKIAKADIIISIAGRDAGTVYYVMNVEEPFLYLADGKKHHVDAPKKKQCKHTRFLAKGNSAVAEKISRGEGITDSELRKAIAAYRGGNQNQEE